MEKIVKILRKIEEKIINEDYNDLLLDLSKIKQEIEHLSKLDKQYSERYKKIHGQFNFPVDFEEFSYEYEQMMLELLEKIGFKELPTTIRKCE